MKKYFTFFFAMLSFNIVSHAYAGDEKLKDGDFVSTQSECESKCDGQCLQTSNNWMCSGIPK